MSKRNTNIVLCREYDESTQSILGIINQIELERKSETQPITTSIVTFISGYGCDLETHFEMDYYIKCVEDTSVIDNNDYSNRISYLFSVRMEQNEKGSSISTEGKVQQRASYSNTFQNIAQIEKKILLPCSGEFEIQVFMNNQTQEKSAIKRYKNYMRENVNPECIYYFNVKYKD